MTKENFYKMCQLRIILHSSYGCGIIKEDTDKKEELFQEYMKLRKEYSDCKGQIK